MTIFRLKEQSALNDEDQAVGAKSAMMGKSTVVTGGSEQTPVAEMAKTMTGGAPQQTKGATVAGAGIVGDGVKSPDNSAMTETPAGSEKVVREVVLRGPASHAMTEMLNIFLGKHNGGDSLANLRSEKMRVESTILQSVTMQQIQEEEEEEEQKGKAKAYVYVFDGRKMGLHDVDALEQILEKPQEDGGYVAAVTVDHADQFVQNHKAPMALSDIAQRAESKGIPFFYTVGACGRYFGAQA